MNVFEGAEAREALVERLVNEMAPTNGIVRFHIIGAIRLGVLEATHEIAQMYPQLAERIYAKFGMSGWDDKPSPQRAIPNDGLNQEEGHHATKTSAYDIWPRGSRGRKPR